MMGKKLGTVSLEGSVWHYMDAKTVAAYGPWVRQVDAAAREAAAYERAANIAGKNAPATVKAEAIRALATSDQTDAPAPVTVGEEARERVAKAIFEANSGKRHTWDGVHEVVRSQAYQIADAALRALSGEAD